MSQNLFLHALPSLSIFNPPLERVMLRQRDIVCDAGQLMSRVYFPMTAVVSVVVEMEDGAMIESAMIGRDGLAGGLAAMDGRECLHKIMVQLSGTCMVCTTAAFKSAMMHDPHAFGLLMKHEQVNLAQTQQTAACNVTHSLEARLARWMLRAKDLAQSNDLTFTQEFISEMLGVGRTTVSITAHQLQAAGLIRYVRGRIHILNPDGLRDVACECYEQVKGNYDSLWSKKAERDAH
jgi:CRP-like cAMP-binding protein